MAALGRCMSDLATIGLDQQPHEGAVLREERSQDPKQTRRERLLRAARCYLLATGEELESCPGRRLRIK